MGAENIADAAARLRFEQTGAEEVVRRTNDVDRAQKQLAETNREESQSRVAQILRNKEYVDALRKQGVGAAQARQELRLLLAAEKDEAAELARGTRQREAAAVAAQKQAVASEKAVAAVIASGNAAKGVNPAVESLIFSFNGLAASAVGIPQSFGTLASRLLPFLAGGEITAGLLVGLTVLSAAWKAFGGAATDAADAAAEAAKRTKETLDGLQDAGNVAGLRGKARALYFGNPSAGFFSDGRAKDGITGLTAEIGREQARFDAAVRQSDLFVFESAKRNLADLKSKIAPIQAQFDDIRRRILEPGPNLDGPDPSPITVTARRNRPQTDAQRTRAARDANADALFRASERALRGIGNVGQVDPSQMVSVNPGRLTNGINLNTITRNGALNPFAPGGGEYDIEGGQTGFDWRKAGLAQMGESLRQQAAETIGNSLIDGISAGLERGFSTGSISEGFKGLAGALLGGLGGAIEQFGKGILAAAPLMVAIQTALRGFNPAASIPAGIALVALGASIKGLAGRAFASGNKASGGANFGASYGSGLSSSSTIDRGVISGAYGDTSVGMPSGGLATPRFVNVNVGLLNPADPSSQRVIVDTIRNAGDRGLVAA